DDRQTTSRRRTTNQCWPLGASGPTTAGVSARSGQPGMASRRWKGVSVVDDADRGSRARRNRPLDDVDVVIGHPVVEDLQGVVVAELERLGGERLAERVGLTEFAVHRVSTRA